MSPAHFQRTFSAWVGVSPKRYQQYLTLDHAKDLLARRMTLLDTATDAGLSGTGRLHDLFLRWEAMSPGDYARGADGITIRHGTFPSPFGAVLAMGTDRGLCGLAFTEECGPDAAFADLAARWPNARLTHDPVPLKPWVEAAFTQSGEARLLLIGAPFQIKVWEALLRVPTGHVTTYSALARAIGQPAAVRATRHGGRPQPGQLPHPLPPGLAQIRRARRLPLGPARQARPPRLGRRPCRRGRLTLPLSSWPKYSGGPGAEPPASRPRQGPRPPPIHARLPAYTPWPMDRYCLTDGLDPMSSQQSVRSFPMHLSKLMIATLVGVTTLSACVAPQGGPVYTTGGTYPTNDPNQRAKQGVLMGAIGGAALGALTGDDNDKTSDRALGGAVLGAFAGGMYGNYLDQQASELQRDIRSNGVRIVNEGDRLRVIMPEGILFPVDSATVNGGIMNDLYTVADSLNRYPGSRVDVVGHTDNTGSAAYNQDLSERRALAVSAILRNAGVAGGRLRPVGMGEDQPIASNASTSGRAQNRRVEIVIIPQG